MKNESKEKEIIKLENRIWKTYQSRIITASKLLKKSKLLDFLSALYSICLSIMSVSALIKENTTMNYGCVVISIVVMGLILYGNTINYKDRYINMKDNYLKLGDLYYNCLNDRLDGSIDFLSIEKDYSKLLNTVENHSTIDFLTFMVHDKQEKTNVSLLEKCRVHINEIGFFLIGLIFSIIPILLFILSFIRLL